MFLSKFQSLKLVQVILGDFSIVMLFRLGRFSRFMFEGNFSTLLKTILSSVLKSCSRVSSLSMLQISNPYCWMHPLRPLAFAVVNKYTNAQDINNPTHAVVVYPRTQIEAPQGNRLVLLSLSYKLLVYLVEVQGVLKYFTLYNLLNDKLISMILGFLWRK